MLSANVNEGPRRKSTNRILPFQQVATRRASAALVINIE